jgi:hypothetical protein
MGSVDYCNGFMAAKDAVLLVKKSEMTVGVMKM